MQNPAQAGDAGFLSATIGLAGRVR
jgi:hypothetical protein